MLAKLILATALIVCAASQLVDAQTLKKIRIASKAPGESLVPYTISQRLGFYREEGFDVDVIVTHSPQASHLPCQREEAAPQFWQMKERPRLDI